MKKEIYIFGEKVPLFSLMIIIGLSVGITLFLLELKRSNKSEQHKERLFCLIPIIILGGFLGGVIYDKIAHWNDSDSFILAGISVTGGVLSGILLYFIFYPIIVSKNKIDKYNDLEHFVPALTITQSFGRIGCFFAGCCYGIKSDSFLAVTFPEGSIQHLQHGEIFSVLPTQLFESFFLLCLFITVLPLKKNRAEVYTISYGIFRFFIEFLRGDNRGTFGSVLSPSQIFSFVFIIVGILIIILKKKTKYYCKKEIKEL